MLGCRCRDQRTTFRTLFSISIMRIFEGAFELEETFSGLGELNFVGYDPGK